LNRILNELTAYIITLISTTDLFSLTHDIATNQLIEFTPISQYKATDFLNFIAFFCYYFGLHVQAYNLTSDMKKKLFLTLLCAVS
jgi:hypothetical protein